MKTSRIPKPIPLALALALLGMIPVGSFPVQGQGMPAENRANIHTLFSNHDKLTRTVTRTEKGYVAVTESDDPQVVAALRAHIKQMSSRLESGLMVRRWDPAFAEYVAHYREIKHRFEKTKQGVRMTVTGKTPAAIKVAQNHAAVISEFIKDGWSAHDRTHPAVAATPTTAGAPAAPCGKCCANRAGR